jgi:hypothetical protein
MINTVELKIRIGNIEIIRSNQFNENYELHQRIRKWIQVVHKEYTHRDIELSTIKVNDEDMSDMFISKNRGIDRPDGIH